ncbi:serine protease [Aquabacterium humicola]|uniref:serine protease n=1 Tax=Aquabacterium humicola TaxID=3237377 RepID=UPI002543C826|nr:serine protease [Rubrivivax pictus]
MRPATPEERARILLTGKLPDAQPWELGEAAQSIASELRDARCPVTREGVQKAATVLNSARHFEASRSITEAWQALRAPDATIARLQAQALIELNALDAAEQVLNRSIARFGQGADAPSPKEAAEHQGLLGRIEKQRFVADGEPARLREGIKRYLTTYRQHPARPYWHGINSVALLCRQERDGLGSIADDGTTASSLANELRQQLLAQWLRNPGDYWMAATLSEAALALDLPEDAELWLYRFLHHPDTTPFAIDSYDRQLREIWEGRAVGPGPALASRLTGIIASHLLRTQSRMTVSRDQLRDMARQLDADPAHLEKNFSGERGISLSLLTRMVQSCASIGCVSNRSGERLGTGFLVAGNCLSEAWGPAPVFVTNAHVISNDVANAIAPGDALVSFEVESLATKAPVFHEVAGNLLFSSKPAELGYRCADGDHLDVSVVRLANLAPSHASLECSLPLPTLQGKAKAFVVGHPQGSGLQVSLHDSLLLDIDDDKRLVHYRTPTDPGSSGSPVFNSVWKVIALHHGGSATTPRLHGEGSYEANEGISIAAIKRRASAA